jgi:uncharacterized protein (UPF0261 family)
MISCGPIQRKDKNDSLWEERRLAERKLLVQDAFRVQARTSPEEMKTIAEEAAKRLNRHPNKRLVKFLIPSKGFSSLSVEGGALHDPACDQVFVLELKKNLDPQIEVVKLDTHINTQEFARALVDVLHKIL